MKMKHSQVLKQTESSSETKWLTKGNTAIATPVSRQDSNPYRFQSDFPLKCIVHRNKKMKILIIDDQSSARRIIRSLLRDINDVDIFEADSLPTARTILSEHSIDLALIDIRLEDDSRNRDGQILVREINQLKSTLAIVVSSLSEMEEIREAMRNGAYDYIIKDALSKELIIPVIEKLRGQFKLENEVRELRAREAKQQISDIVLGTSPAMADLFAMIKRVTLSDRPVLVTGPTGSGKELVVRAIHRLGAHPDSPLLDINCGAIPENLIESQLFGHEKGSFTGAVSRQDGYFSTVRDGTLFLDEIAEMPLNLQPGLLRVLETRRFRPLGASAEQQFRGRIVAATNADLEQNVRDKTFREDLLYRLNVFVLNVPSLNEHLEDIPALVSHFSKDQPRELRFSEEAIDALKQADWPGNVRQLKTVIDRIAVLTDDDPVNAASVQQFVAAESGNQTDLLDAIAGTLLRLNIGEDTDKLTALENAVIVRAMKETSGNKTAAARLLGVNRKIIERRQQKIDDSQS